MCRLIYISTAIKKFSEYEINELLAFSRKKNKQNNITGFLIIKGKTFIQVIEGENINVDSLFEKIKDDDRHENILTIEKREISKRLFEEWDMGFKCFEELSLTESKKLKEFNFENPKELPTIFERIVEIF